VTTPLAYHLEGVAHRYGGRTVLEVERIDVGPWEFLGLIGPTGAGKSTLLRLLAGVERPSAGHVRLGDRPLDGAGSPRDLLRRATLVFQRPLLLRGTARTNVEYGLRLRGVREPGPAAGAALARLGVDGLAERDVRTLSGGEAQLVALARALVLRPEVLLLDEPTANLDPLTVFRVEEAVRDLHQAHGSTVVWATHNLPQAARLATRAVLLLRGQVVEDAPAREFFGSPRDPRTAAFLRGELVY
jgi:tungstate transport system ATP-binding protein